LKVDPDPARRRKRAKRARRARTVRVIALDPEPRWRRLRRIGARAKALLKGHWSNVLAGFLAYKGFSNYIWDYMPSTSQKVFDFGAFSMQQNNLIGIAGATISPFLFGKRMSLKTALGGLIGGLLGFASDVAVTLKRQAEGGSSGSYSPIKYGVSI
jgi:hypothetical protein